MEAVVFDDSPLGEYLEGEGGEDPHGLSSQEPEAPSEPSSPSFAPRGKPKARLKLRHRVPTLRLSVPQNHAVAVIHEACSRVVTSKLGNSENAKFLERFRYIIVASQLLSSRVFHAPVGAGQSRDVPAMPPNAPQFTAFTLVGAGITACFAFSLTWLVNWTRGGRTSISGMSRMAISVALLALFAAVSYAYMRRQWLQSLRQRSLTESSELIANSQDFDNAMAGALTLVQEVELVSRGYRVSSPLPPISRLEDHKQTRRCARLRRGLQLSFSSVIPRYKNACTLLKPLAEQMDLEKYYDIYDISDIDYSEAMLGFSETEFEDTESLRVLKILAARFHTIRKVFLCCLLALDADGGKYDFPRWSTALDEIGGISVVTKESEARLRQVLKEEESFSLPTTPKIPLTPNRERWRAQLRKLNSLSSGIRGLQAKLHVLREESDKNLNETDDVAELGTSLMIQYESIGIDLKGLMREWEDGKAALASNIDRNERRISSIGSVLSPTFSLGGVTSVDDGNPMDALKILNGEALSRSSMDFSSSDVEEVYEAIALPRPRSKLTRDERIVKMKEDRVKRDSLREKAESNTRMLRELESVIKMRPRGKTAPSGRVTSL